MGFELFAGNEKTINTLQQMISAGRLPHAMLLEGDEGLGKFTLASIIAAAAVCGKENAPCGSCGNCHLAEIGNHPDITIIAPEGKLIKVDTVREVINAAYIKPSQAQKKVFIFKDAHRMNEAGQNALLKTLEEPPQSVIFILLAESSAALLPTVISRCTLFSLSPPDKKSGIEILCKMGFSEEEAAQRLMAAAGNIGRAAAEKAKKSKISPQEFIELIAAGDSYSALLLLRKLEKDRTQATLFFEELHTCLLQARRNEALGMGDFSLSAEYLRFMTIEADKAADALKKNGNLSLIFHTLCLNLR